MKRLQKHFLPSSHKTCKDNSTCTLNFSHINGSVWLVHIFLKSVVNVNKIRTGPRLPELLIKMELNRNFETKFPASPYDSDHLKSYLKACVNMKD